MTKSNIIIQFTLLLWLVALCNSRSLDKYKLEENLVSLEQMLKTLMVPDNDKVNAGKISVNKLVKVQDEDDEVTIEIEDDTYYNTESTHELNKSKDINVSDEEPHAQDRSASIRNTNVLDVDEKASLQDIYYTEELPRVSRILTSANATTIDKFLSDSKSDPFAVLIEEIKYHGLLTAEFFYAFLFKLMKYFLIISLALPAVVPFFEIVLVFGDEFLKLFV